MSIRKSNALQVAALAREVADLADKVVLSIDTATDWGNFDGKYQDRPRYPDGSAPDAAYIVSSMDTAYLRRRSMDLTRALAQLRKGAY